MARVVVTRQLPGTALDRLAAEHETEVWPGKFAPPPEQFEEMVADAEGLLCMLTERIDAKLLDRAPRLRAIANYAVGFDNVDLAETARRGIPVGNTPDVLTDATADLAMALILAVARRVPEAAAAAHVGTSMSWGAPSAFLGLELKGATLLIVGAGRIGRATADRARGFGVEVLLAHHHEPLPPLLARADVVSLHVPLTAETHHMIDDAALRAMRPGALLVNTARGPLVDQEALRRALLDGHLGGAGLDVTEPEPLPPDHPLFDAPTVLVLPHIGSATHAARGRMADMAVDNLLAALAGRPMPHPAPPPA